MDQVLAFAFIALTSFFTLINPFGSMPVFITMTSELSSEKRNKTARKAVIVSFFTLILFAFTGQLLFKFFGISVHSLRIVGGIIFFMMGYDMLQARLGKIKLSGKEEEINAYVDDISVTPLAIPMISGPGAITNAIVMMEDADNAAKKATLIIVIAAIMLVTYLVFISAGKITKRLGPTGNKVLMKIMGLIVMVIAVEFFFGGLKPIILSIVEAASK